MENITIPKKQAEALYELLGQKLNHVPERPKKWEDIKTFEDAYAIVPLNESQSALLALPMVDKDVMAAQAVMKLTIISRAMNKLANGGKEWKPDWTNSSEYKYYPWLKFLAGSGFSAYVFDYAYSGTTVGSRLCFKSADMARHAATHFKDLYNDFFTL